MEDAHFKLLALEAASPKVMLPTLLSEDLKRQMGVGSSDNLGYPLNGHERAGSVRMLHPWLFFCANTHLSEPA